MAAKTKTAKARATLADALAPRLKPVGRRHGQGAARRTHGGRGRDAAARPEGAALPARNASSDRFLAAVMEDSPFLRALMLDDPGRLRGAPRCRPGRPRSDDAHATPRRAWRGRRRGRTDDGRLRQARQEVALLVALADLGGVWDVATVTAALTGFADAAVGAAVRFILAGGACGRRRSRWPTRTSPKSGRGWIILGMGKFGAGELNYSSDIDLIVLFDPEIAPLAESAEPSVLFVRLTKRLVQHPQRAHRRRLRLPHRPAAAPRSRLDQRRHVDRSRAPILREHRAELGAGGDDQGAPGRRRHARPARPFSPSSRRTSGGNISTTPPSPTSTRSSARSTTSAAIDEVARRRPQHQARPRRHPRDRVLRPDPATDRRRPQPGAARPRHARHAGARWPRRAGSTRRRGDDLTAAYFDLRRVEHCLQMIADEQTHTLPEDEAALAVDRRHGRLRHDRRLLARRCSTTLQHGPRPLCPPVRDGARRSPPSLGSLVFTGDDDDPETLATLSGLGYRQPGGSHPRRCAAGISAAIRRRARRRPASA